MNMYQSVLAAFVQDAGNDEVYKSALLRPGTDKAYQHTAYSLKNEFPNKKASLLYPDAGEEKARSWIAAQSKALSVARGQLMQGQHEEGSTTGVTVEMAGVTLNDDEGSALPSIWQVLSWTTTMCLMSAWALALLRASTLSITAPKLAVVVVVVVVVGTTWKSFLNSLPSSNDDVEFFKKKLRVVNEDSQLTKPQKEKVNALVLKKEYAKAKSFITELEKWTEKIENASTPDHRAVATEEKENLIQAAFLLF